MDLLIFSIKKLKQQIFYFLPVPFTTGIFHRYGNAFSTAVFSTVIHRLILDKQIGFVISGPFSQISNLREIFEAYVGMQHCNLVGFVSDDMGNSAEINAALQNMASNAVM